MHPHGGLCILRPSGCAGDPTGIHVRTPVATGCAIRTHPAGPTVPVNPSGSGEGVIEMKYEVYISVSGNAMVEINAASELDAEIAAQDLVDNGKIDWTDFDSNILACVA